MVKILVFGLSGLGWPGTLHCVPGQDTQLSQYLFHPGK